MNNFSHLLWSKIVENLSRLYSHFDVLIKLDEELLTNIMVIVELYLNNIFDELYHHSIIEHDVDLLNRIDEYQSAFELRQIIELIMDHYHY
jgi:hypothetical protein